MKQIQAIICNDGKSIQLSLIRLFLYNFLYTFVYGYCTFVYQHVYKHALRMQIQSIIITTGKETHILSFITLHFI